MKVFDLDLLCDDALIETDLCIVGSGPAGLSIANEFANLGTKILLLEGGGFDEEPESHSLYTIECVGGPRKVDQSAIRSRGLGGSSRIWTGRCAPFDALDFEPRPWIAHSGWPFSLVDIQPYLERAGTNLGLGPNRYDESLWSEFRVSRPLPPLNERPLKPMFWQFSRSPRDQKISVDFGRDLTNVRSDNIQILVHANLTHINTSPDGGRFESADVRTLRGKQARIRSRALVLCCGGIENARLLLSSNRSAAHGLGNQNDLVGRFLMDHTDCRIWDLGEDSAQRLLSRFGTYWLDNERARHVFLHGLGLSRELQQEERLLNCHAYIDQFGLAEDDPWSAIQRLVPALRSRRLSENTRRDAQQVLRSFGEISRGLYRRSFAHRPQRVRAQRYELHFILEQKPDPASRITLSTENRDALGMPLAKIDWKISDLERQTAKRMSLLLHDEFRRLDLPALDVPHWLDDLGEWVSRCTEKAHPTGTTRMAVSAKEGVVNENCQVHGVEGLFVAGSSVFPTSGAANPTLMIVAMSLRLADWLKSNYFAVSSERPEKVEFPSLSFMYQKTRRETESSTVIKIGLVGTGRRIREIYLPILEQMSSRYQIAGFATGSAEGSRRFESQTGIKSFASAQELADQKEPDLLVVAVPDRRTEATVDGLLDHGIPLLVETPLAWSAAGVRKLIAKAAMKKVTIGVAEQFPFLPLEQFRKTLLELGVFGNVFAAFNDFHSYSYHGIAQLRRYLKGNPTKVRNEEFHFENGVRWQSGSVIFTDGARLQHNYAVLGQALHSSVHFHGTAGSMSDEVITVCDSASGESQTASLVRNCDSSGRLVSISASLPKIGEVRWSNRFAEFNFSDEQIAVATLLDGMAAAVRKGIRPLYTADESLLDIEIVQALRYGSVHGRVIRLPLQENVQKALALAGRVLRRRLSS
ncbi:GMC oxidoreductase [Bradyrhizobium sp. McL0616]|uniref:GMC oxidoreductase n=1 Tax=Bradyrhizobium sp. McL0616 TaxID=3415674 RepID=UPI003CE883E7